MNYDDILAVQKALNEAPPPPEVTGIVNGKYFRARHTKNGEYEVSDLQPSDSDTTTEASNAPLKPTPKGTSNE